MYQIPKNFGMMGFLKGESMANRQRLISKKIEIEVQLVAAQGALLKVKDDIDSCYPVADGVPLKVPFQRIYDDYGVEFSTKIDKAVKAIEELRGSNLGKLADIIKEPHIQQ